MTINGQVYQGASDNKGKRLDVAPVDYQDTNDDDTVKVAVTYMTEATLPSFDPSLRDILHGSFSGDFLGVVAMQGDLENDGVAGTRYKADSVHITSTVFGPAGGVYDIDIER